MTHHLEGGGIQWSTLPSSASIWRSGVSTLHGARADGAVAFRKKLSRERLLAFVAFQPRCIVAMEACASAQHWGRKIGKLGHEVKLVPPSYVKPYLHTGPRRFICRNQ